MHSIQFRFVSSLALLLLLTTGCTQTVKLAIHPPALPEGPKSPRHATLVVSDELKQYRHEFKMGGGTVVYPFGPVLADHAQRIVTHAFTGVRVAPSLDVALQESPDLILVPRPGKAEQNMPIWAWDQSEFVLAVQWSAMESGRSEPVWMRTIVAESAQKAGNVFSGKKNERILFQRLFDDLNQKTLSALRDSPELR